MSKRHNPESLKGQGPRHPDRSNYMTGHPLAIDSASSPPDERGQAAIDTYFPSRKNLSPVENQETADLESFYQAGKPPKFALQPSSLRDFPPFSVKELRTFSIDQTQ